MPPVRVRWIVGSQRHRHAVVEVRHDPAHDLLRVRVDGERVATQVERGPLIRGVAYRFGVVEQPAELRIEPSRTREYLLVGPRPTVYDLTVAGRRVVYEGAITAARLLLIVHLGVAGLVAFAARSLSEAGRASVVILLVSTAIAIQVLARPVLSRWPPKKTTGGDMASPWGLLALLIVPLVVVLAVMLMLGLAPGADGAAAVSPAAACRHGQAVGRHPAVPVRPRREPDRAGRRSAAPRGW